MEGTPQAALDLFFGVALSKVRILDAESVEDEEAIAETKAEGFLHTLNGHHRSPRHLRVPALLLRVAS
jgi:hypothetical protein